MRGGTMKFAVRAFLTLVLVCSTSFPAAAQLTPQAPAATDPISVSDGSGLDSGTCPLTLPAVKTFEAAVRASSFVSQFEIDLYADLINKCASGIAEPRCELLVSLDLSKVPSPRLKLSDIFPKSDRDKELDKARNSLNALLFGLAIDSVVIKDKEISKKITELAVAAIELLKKDPVDYNAVAAKIKEIIDILDKLKDADFGPASDKWTDKNVADYKAKVLEALKQLKEIHPLLKKIAEQNGAPQKKID